MIVLQEVKQDFSQIQDPFKKRVKPGFDSSQKPSCERFPSDRNKLRNDVLEKT